MEVEVEISLLIQMKPFLAFHVMIHHQIHMVQILKLQVQEPKRLDFQISNQVKQVSKVVAVTVAAAAVLAKVTHLPEVA